jgi:hypothetical protein
MVTAPENTVRITQSKDLNQCSLTSPSDVMGPNLPMVAFRVAAYGGAGVIDGCDKY